jgi:hypothetical protein
MEIQDLILCDQKKYIIELKKINSMKKQNDYILKKFKNVEELYNNTIESLINQVNQKNDDIEKFNDMFMENNKHLKYILTNIAKF